MSRSCKPALAGQRRSAKRCEGANLHGEAASLDLHAVDGDVSLGHGGFEIMCKGCDKDVLRPWMSACPNCSSKCSPFQHISNRAAVLIFNARGQVQGVCFDRRHPLPLGD